MIILSIPNEKEMLASGSRFATRCPARAIIFLQGDLGAGKTTWARGFLRGLNYLGLVKSPTYTLVESYEIDTQCIFHFDLYRVAEPKELVYIGLEEYVNRSAICLIEWPERGKGLLPKPDITLFIQIAANGRTIEATAGSPVGTTLLQSVYKE